MFATVKSAHVTFITLEIEEFAALGALFLKLVRMGIPDVGIHPLFASAIFFAIPTPIMILG